MELHPATALFPMMGELELTELAKDIQANGLQVPIVIYQGMILDGRNRSKACEMAGVEPRYQEWQGEGSPTAWVISLNLHRRHLTQSQKAAIAVDALPLFEEEARMRQKKHGGTAPGRPKGRECPDCHIISPSWPPADEPPEIIHPDNAWEYIQCPNCSYVMRDTLRPKLDEVYRRADQQAASMFGVARSYVADAKKLKTEAPTLYESVRTGDLSITQAKRELVRQQAKEAPPLPSSKYRVIYADPPWSYGNTQPDYHTEQRDHYQVMSLTDICAMRVKELVEDNAVLFLWVTSPILEESFQVINAWGFKYKASFVWDKIKHNMGHYNSVRHELLLIATRGSCQPDVPRLLDSVVSVEREEHSKKPGLFREIIDMLYPNGRRIELFAREGVAGWDAHGNELEGSAVLSRR